MLKHAVKHNDKEQKQYTQVYMYLWFQVLTSQLWEEGTISSSFLPVKMSIATKWHLAWPCFPVLEVDTSTTCHRQPTTCQKFLFTWEEWDQSRNVLAARKICTQNKVVLQLQSETLIRKWRNLILRRTFENWNWTLIRNIPRPSSKKTQIVECLQLLAADCLNRLKKKEKPGKNGVQLPNGATNNPHISHDINRWN